MSAQDPNRYSFEGIYSWGEPQCGSRLEWKSDQWKFLKLGLFPATIFGIAAFSHIGMSAVAVGWLSVISAGLMGYVFLWSYLPRTIRLFQDKVCIVRPGGRAASTRNVYYSDIEGFDVAPDKAGERITLKLRTGRIETLFSPDKEGAERLTQLIKNSKNA